MIKLTAIFAYIIDFRNPFTAEHSTGVAAVARALAAYMGFSDTECKMIYVAGHLHDLGKLTVSEIILNKPDSLNKEEISVMRSHTYHTYRILQKVKGLETINEWASYHHEKLNGKGYPFHLAAKDLSTGSRIMAVADIFTAIMEDRPYRRGMPAAKAKSLLQSMVDNGSICKEVVAVTDAHFDQVNEIRKNAQNNTLAVYRNLMYQR
jgi:HD-GYP domain-containing protein (c-di-GMP phosphodiesterase class II)